MNELCAVGISKGSMLCLDLTDNCLSLALVVVLAIAIGYLICRGIRAHRHRTPESLHDRNAIETEKEELRDQTQRLKSGLQRIINADDPLKAFTDALSARDERRRDENRL